MARRSAWRVILSAEEREGSGRRNAPSPRSFAVFAAQDDILALLLVLVLFISCAQTPAPPPMTTSGPRVTLPDGYTVAVEIAADDDTRAQGLMFRDQVREGAGMLFLFRETGDYPFWMKNTLIPLDMVWIDESRKVVHVAANVPPCKADPCPSYPPNAPARYVLELAGGVAQQHRVVTGSTLRFDGIENVIVR